MKNQALKSKPEPATKQQAGPGRAAPTGYAMAPEEWWARHASLLSAKMNLSGVKSFRIWRIARGKFAFEVMPEESSENGLGAAGAQSQGPYLGAAIRQLSDPHNAKGQTPATAPQNHE